MKVFARYVKSAFLMPVISFGLAVTCVDAQVYKWVDDDGNIRYQDFPPPEEVDYEEREYDTERKAGVNAEEQDADARLDAAVASSPISLYSIPECEVCDLTRLYLESLSVPFTEKEVHEDPAVQQELKERSGELLVPTVIIGDKIIDGYSKSALYEALSEKGYPLDWFKSRKDSAGGDSDGQE